MEFKASILGQWSKFEEREGQDILSGEIRNGLEDAYKYLTSFGTTGTLYALCRESQELCLPDTSSMTSAECSMQFPSFGVGMKDPEELGVQLTLAGVSVKEERHFVSLAGRLVEKMEGDLQALLPPVVKISIFVAIQVTDADMRVHLTEESVVVNG